MFLYNSVLMTIEDEWRMKVDPSGADRATSWAAMLPFAPERFSATIGWPSASLRFWA